MTAVRRIGLLAPLAALSLAYGPIFLVAAAPPLLVAAVRWVGAASREWMAVDRDDLA